MYDLQESENFIHNKFGYCYYCIEKDYALIYNLYVYPEWRRVGHSKYLLEYVINEIRKSGYTGEINIEAIPRENSIDFNKLIEYYKSMGLKII